jgi:hypothetical protein
MSQSAYESLSWSLSIHDRGQGVAVAWQGPGVTQLGERAAGARGVARECSV